MAFPTVRRHRLVTAAARPDRAAMRTEIARRLGGKAAFLDQFSGEARRTWRRSLFRQVLLDVIAEARDELGRLLEAHTIVEYTATERAALANCEQVLACAPIDGDGNQAYSRAAACAATIREQARVRARASALANLRTASRSRSCAGERPATRSASPSLLPDMAEGALSDI